MASHRQLTLDGGILKTDTYFKHQATTSYEKFVEAVYFLNKATRNKKECLEEANKLWKTVKSDDQAVRNYIRKHEEELSKQTKKKSTFFFKPITNKRKLKQVNVPEQVLKETVSFVPDAIQATISRLEYINKFEKGMLIDFLDDVKQGLSKFLDETVFSDKMCMSALMALCKTFGTISKQLKVLRQTTLRSKKSNLRADVQQVDTDLIRLVSLIEKATDIKIESSLGLTSLQTNVLAKQNLLRDISIVATKLESFIKFKNLKESLNRRVSQINKRDFSILHKDNNFEAAKCFCYNSSSLSWEDALSNLMTTSTSFTKSNVLEYDKLLQLGFLMESSAIIPVESVFEQLEMVFRNDIIDLLLKCFPLYHIKTSDKKEVLLNIHQNMYGCEAVDELFATTESQEKPKKISKHKSDDVIAGAKLKKPSVGGGQPSIVSLFPEIPDIVTDYIKRNGYKAQEKRRNENFESCGVTLADVRTHILETVPGLKEHGISKTTVRYLFSPVHKRRNSAKLYKEHVACRVPMKDNSLRVNNERAHFIHSRVAMRLEHAAKFKDDYLILSADAMNKIHVGVLAVSRYDPFTEDKLL